MRPCSSPRRSTSWATRASTWLRSSLTAAWQAGASPWTSGLCADANVGHGGLAASIGENFPVAPTSRVPPPTSRLPPTGYDYRLPPTALLSQQRAAAAARPAVAGEPL